MTARSKVSVCDLVWIAGLNSAGACMSIVGVSCCVVLCCVVLCCVVLRCVVLCCFVLCFVVLCCVVLSGRGLCIRPITFPGESYRLWCSECNR